MPLFVLDTMGGTPGLTGLFLAGVCSSALCSVSAALNSLAAVTLEDYIAVKYEQCCAANAGQSVGKTAERMDRSRNNYGRSIKGLVESVARKCDGGLYDDRERTEMVKDDECGDAGRETRSSKDGYENRR